MIVSSAHSIIQDSARCDCDNTFGFHQGIKSTGDLRSHPARRILYQIEEHHPKKSQKL